MKRKYSRIALESIFDVTVDIYLKTSILFISFLNWQEYRIVKLGKDVIKPDEVRACYKK